jgi:hypothetical protein
MCYLLFLAHINQVVISVKAGIIVPTIIAILSALDSPLPLPELVPGLLLPFVVLAVGSKVEDNEVVEYEVATMEGFAGPGSNASAMPENKQTGNGNNVGGNQD